MQFPCHLIRVPILPWHNWFIICQSQRVHELFENQKRVTHISYTGYLAPYPAVGKFLRYILIKERERERVQEQRRKEKKKGEEGEKEESGDRIGREKIGRKRRKEGK